jgi:hypothetical protein
MKMWEAFASERLEIISPFPPEECARRILAEIDVERATAFLVKRMAGARPVVGRVNGSSILLRKRVSYNNSFQTFLTATLQPHGTGTVIQGELALHPFTRVFMPVWFGGVVLFGGAALFVRLLGLLTHHPSPAENNAWLVMVIPLGMLLFGYLLVRFGRYLARDEACFLTDFLDRILEAGSR